MLRKVRGDEYWREQIWSSLKSLAEKGFFKEDVAMIKDRWVYFKVQKPAVIRKSERKNRFRET